jgi:uncharacterized membrane protein YhiD involved in acid resistance
MANILTFNDVIKLGSDQLGFGGRLNPIDIAVTLLITWAVSLVVFMVYKKSYHGPVYDKTLNIAMVLICLVTSMVILTISSNIVLSLGMVGALSIVRMRTAIKDPFDIVFIFWHIAIGISSGAGLHIVSIVGTIILSFALLMMNQVSKQDQMVVIRLTGTSFDVGEVKALLQIKDEAVDSILKQKGYQEVMLTLHLIKEDALEKLTLLNGIEQVNVLYKH